MAIAPPLPVEPPKAVAVVTPKPVSPVKVATTPPAQNEMVSTPEIPVAPQDTPTDVPEITTASENIVPQTPAETPAPIANLKASASESSTGNNPIPMILTLAGLLTGVTVLKLSSKKKK